ncbi:hypothetical protein [Amycolatopsis sp. w19]|uniref:hypothetical protein n=1 Tax=Amycolatopsis sp. w19 TaxID=3448134 RepID=UPI003F1D2279
MVDRRWDVPVLVERGEPWMVVRYAERVRLKKPAIEALATAGAFTSLGPERRQALWAAGAAATTRPEHLPGLAPGLDAPALPGMTRFEVTARRPVGTGISPGSHSVEYLRTWLTEHAAISAAQLSQAEDGARVWIGERSLTGGAPPPRARRCSPAAPSYTGETVPGRRGCWPCRSRPRG